MKLQMSRNLTFLQQTVYVNIKENKASYYLSFVDGSIGDLVDASPYYTN